MEPKRRCDSYRYIVGWVLSVSILTYIFVYSPACEAGETKVEWPNLIARNEIRFCTEKIEIKTLKFLPEVGPNGVSIHPNVSNARIALQIDLNGDGGTCELILMSTEFSGTGGDNQEVYEKHGDAYRNIGSIFGFGIFPTEKKNGYFQITSGGKSGAGNYFSHLYTFINGRYELTLSANTREIRNFLVEGEAAYRKGALSKAETLLMTAIHKNPDDYAGRVALGLVYLKLKQYSRAKEMLRKVTESPSPAYPYRGATNKLRANAYYNLGLTFERQGNKEEALNAYRRSYAYDPNKIRETTLRRLAPGEQLPAPISSDQPKDVSQIKSKPVSADRILSVRIARESANEVELDVEYVFSRHAKNAGTISALPTKSGQKDSYWAFRPMKVEPGRKKVKLKMWRNRPVPSNYCTEGFYIRLDSKTGWVAGKYFKHEKCW